MGWSKKQKYAAILIPVLALMIFIGAAVAANWFSVPSFLFSESTFYWISGLFFSAVLIFFAVRLTGSSYQVPQFSGGRKTKQQLTDDEAFNVLEEGLLDEHLMKGVRENYTDRGSDHVGTPGDNEDPIRLYKLIFKRKMVDEWVGVYIDLEQKFEADIDTDNFEELLEVYYDIEVKRDLRRSSKKQLKKDMEEAREELGKNLYRQMGEYEKFQYDPETGNIVGKERRPALPPQVSGTGHAQSRASAKSEQGESGGEK